MSLKYYFALICTAVPNPTELL